jgi:phosphatidate phosphatase APP1
LRGVEAVMNSFPESKFILVGDSGEQESVYVP